MIYYILASYIIPLVILHLMIFLSARKFLMKKRPEYETRAMFIISFIPVINLIGIGFVITDEFVTNFATNYFKWLSKT